MKKNYWFWLWILIGIFMLFVPVLAIAHPYPETVAHQQRTCNLYEVFVGIITNQYDEELVDAKKSPEGGRYEIWRSEDTGSWTLIEIMPDNTRACILSTGIGHSDMTDEFMQRNAFEKSS